MSLAVSATAIASQGIPRESKMTGHNLDGRGCAGRGWTREQGMESRRRRPSQSSGSPENSLGL